MTYKHLSDLYNQLLIDYNKIHTEFIKLKHYISIKEKENIETIVSKNQNIARLEKEIEELKINNKSDELVQVSAYDYINKNNIISIQKEQCLTAYGLTDSYEIKTCKKTYYITERNKYFKNIERLLK